MRRRNELLVGLLTTVAVAVLIMGTLWLLRGGLQRGYPLYTRFEWGAGLKQGQPVLFSGVNVGYVDRIDLLENGGLVTTLRIYKDQKVPDGTVASIAPNGLFGDMLIALRAEAPTSRMHEPGDTIPSTVGSVQLTQVLARFDSVAASVIQLTSALERELIERDGLAQLRATARSADAMFQTLREMAVVQSRELTRTQDALRRVTTLVDSIQIDSTLRSMRQAAADFGRLTDELRGTSGRVNAVLAKLESGDGSAARLLNEPGFDQDVRSLMRSLDSLVADIKANPKKYVRISIF